MNVDDLAYRLNQVQVLATAAELREIMKAQIACVLVIVAAALILAASSGRDVPRNASDGPVIRISQSDDRPRSKPEENTRREARKISARVEQLEVIHALK